MVLIYKKTIVPLTGPRCRFYPSCSSYFLECLKKYSLSRAFLKTFKRICSCHPFHPGGVDLP